MLEEQSHSSVKKQEYLIITASHRAIFSISPLTAPQQLWNNVKKFPSVYFLYAKGKG